MKYVKVYLQLFVLSLISAFVIYIFAPDYRSYLLREDSLVENLSVFFFLVSFLIGLFLTLKQKLNRKPAIALSAISLLGLLDEISFGERLFNIDMPIIHGVKIDAVHDLFYLAFKEIIVLSSAHRHYIIIFLLISILVAILLLIKYRAKLRVIITYISSKPPLILAMFFVILVLLALIIDLHIFRSKALFMVEELFEMNAALALLMCGLSLRDQ